MKQHAVDAWLRRDVTTDEAERVKVLERDVTELHRASEALKLASAAFTHAELDRRSSPEGPHRDAPRHLRGRADLQGTAG